MHLVKHNGTGLLGCQGATDKVVALKPGVNQVSPADWAAMKKHPLIKARIESGDLEDITGEAEGGEKSSVEQLLKMKPGEASKVAASTIDRELLASWLVAEKRAGVKKAIETQIAKLDEPAKLRERKGEEDSEESDESDE